MFALRAPLFVLLLASFLAVVMPPPLYAAPAGDAKRREEAQALHEARKFAEADRLYATLIKKNANDAKLHLDAGYNLYLLASSLDDAARAQKLRKRARAWLLRARTLGLDDAIIAMCLNSVREDGSVVEQEFSPHQKADAAMRAGEKAFSKGEFDAARRAYEEALALDPENYAASLYIGDVYFNQNDLERAVEWFAKAVRLNPDIETAHRYWGDAARRAGRHQEALAHYIDAVVAEPYARAPRQMLERFVTNAGLKWRQHSFDLPFTPVKLVGGEIQVQVDPNVNALTLMHGLACAQWRKEEFPKHYSAATPRRSLREEMHALKLMRDVARELGESDPKAVERWRASLDTLESVIAADMLACYVLLERVDDEIAQDYSAYRILSRERIARYIARFWCGLEEPPAGPAGESAPGD